MAQKENAINLAIPMDDSMSHEKAAAHKSDSNQQRTDRQHALKKTADTYLLQPNHIGRTVGKPTIFGRSWVPSNEERP